MKLNIPVAALLLLPAVASAQSLDPQSAAATISAEDLHHRIGVLAHDSMRGRDTPSPELEEVADWIGDEFRAMGLEPAGDDGGWLQRYTIRVLVADLEASSVSSSTGARAAFGEDVLPLRFSGVEDVTAEGSVLLLTGTPTDEATAALELAGRHVVYTGSMRNVVPLLRAAARAGAASVIVGGGARDASWMEAAERARERRSRVVGDAGSGGGMPMLQAHDEALARLLGLEVEALRAGAGGDLRVRELPGVTLTVEQRARVESETSAPNVVGLLRGSDPELADEYVVYSAHMDHVGVGRADESGDSIYNGADDDASGTATVIEVAEAMASLATPPRRSMLFLLVSGEEKGLWGSRYFAEHPPVPLEDIVANVNADMVGRNWPDTIVAIGRQHSSLGETLARVNAAHPEIGMTAIDDLWPEENFYRRSDHFNFARRGVPILFFFNGTHGDYHRPSDELESIDAEKTARIGRLIYWLGLEIGNADERPRWNPASYAEIVEGAGR